MNLEITYTKSMLQVLCEKKLAEKELHYSCPQCHSQNVFVCDGFDSLYQCYQCKTILDTTRVEAEGRPFYSVSKDDFMQYVKEKYPDLYPMTAEPEKEIIPFRPVVVDPSKDNVISTFEKDNTEKNNARGVESDSNFEARLAVLENDKKEKSLFWSIVKIIALLALMLISTGFVLYEWIDIFVFKEQHAILYELYVSATKKSVVKTDWTGGLFISMFYAISHGVVLIIDVCGWKQVKKYYNKIKEENI